MRTYRQRFGDFKKSLPGHEMFSYLGHQQMGICPITKLKLSMSSDTHLSHIIPLKALELMGRYDLCVHPRNLFLEHGPSNVKRKAKVVEELIDDLLLDIYLSEEELEILSRFRSSGQ